MSTDTIKDTYQVISAPSEGEYKEKGSKFLAYAFPVTNTAEVEQRLEEMKALHPKSRHYCYAYRIGIDGDVYRMNDDGEPSGTAGKPIYGQLLSYDVSDALIIVVRYFGGTKLGASGLIHAYKTAASQALSAADLIDRTLSDQYRLLFDYGEMGHTLNVVKALDLHITQKIFEAAPYVDIAIPRSQTQQLLLTLKAHLLQVSLEQVDEKTVVPFCKIEKLENND